MSLITITCPEGLTPEQYADILAVLDGRDTSRAQAAKRHCLDALAALNKVGLAIGMDPSHLKAIRFDENDEYHNYDAVADVIIYRIAGQLRGDYLALQSQRKDLKP